MKIIIAVTIFIIFLLCCPIFKPAASLIPNNNFSLNEDHNNLPDRWQHGSSNLPDIEASRFGWEKFPNSSSKVIWIIYFLIRRMLLQRQS